MMEQVGLWPATARLGSPLGRLAACLLVSPIVMDYVWTLAGKVECPVIVSSGCASGELSDPIVMLDGFLDGVPVINPTGVVLLVAFNMDVSARMIGINLSICHELPSISSLSFLVFVSSVSCLCCVSTVFHAASCLALFLHGVKPRRPLPPFPRIAWPLVSPSLFHLLA